MTNPQPFFLKYDMDNRKQKVSDLLSLENSENCINIETDLSSWEADFEVKDHNGNKRSVKYRIK